MQTCPSLHLSARVPHLALYATTIQLGPAEVVGQPDVDSKRPYYGFARVGHGQTAGSHFHDGYSLLMFTEGEYEIAGETDDESGRSC